MIHLYFQLNVAKLVWYLTSSLMLLCLPILTFVVCLWVFSIKSFLKPVSKSLPPLMLSSWSFMASGLKFKSLIHFKSICESSERWGLVSFICFWISIFLPGPLIEEVVFPSFQLPFQVSVNCIPIGLFLGSQFSPIGKCVCFYASAF